MTYTTGGSCDFKQTIRRILLIKMNEQTGISSQTLLSCSIEQSENCTTSDKWRSLDRGDGLDFIFVLTDTTQNDSGVYQVLVEGTHPGTGNATTILKTIDLEVIGKSCSEMHSLSKESAIFY